MRDAFIRGLVAAAEKHPNLWLLCGDLGYSVLDDFKARFPERYVNVGVAEQNMAGIAAGIALSGGMVFCYSIGNFPTLRCIEQIRNDICYHGANVKIVAVGGGLAYGQQGYTHHAIEDLAVMASLPGMKVAAPGDPLEVEQILQTFLEDDGPCYLRLGKAGEPRIHAKPPRILKGHPVPVVAGKDALLLSTGGMLATARQAIDLLRDRGIMAGLASMPFLKPVDNPALLHVIGDIPLLCTLEEHGPYGGLRDAVARILIGETRLRPQLLPFHIREHSIKGMVGTQDQLRAAAGLDAAAIAAAIENNLRHSHAAEHA
jgi:transketolase